MRHDTEATLFAVPARRHAKRVA